MSLAPSNIATASYSIERYITWSPTDHSSNVGITESNLKATALATGTYSARASDGRSTGKWYWEQTLTEALDNDGFKLDWSGGWVGVGTIDAAIHGVSGKYIGSDAYGWGATNYNQNDEIYCYHGGAKTNTQKAASWTGDGTIIMIALNLDAGTMFFGRDGVWAKHWDGVNFSDPVTGAYPAFTGITGIIYPMCIPYKVGGFGSQVNLLANFGEGGFAYTPPTGYLAFSVPI